MSLTNAQRQAKYRQKAGSRLSISLSEQASISLDRLVKGYSSTKRAVVEYTILLAEAEIFAKLSKAEQQAYLEDTLNRGALHRNGDSIENTEHQKLFTIPKPVTSNETALIQPCPQPEQRAVTGDLEVDAYLWLRSACRTTTDPSFLDKAEQAAARFNSSSNEIGKRYAKYLVSQGADPFVAAMNSFFGDIDNMVKQARHRITVTTEGLSIFGSYLQAEQATPAEQMLEQTVGPVPDGDFWNWKPAEIAKVFEKSINPTTLTEAINELRYWRWLYNIRRAMAETEGGRWDNENILVSARGWFVEHQLCELKPQNQAEILYIVSEIRSGLVDEDKHATIFEHLLLGKISI